MLSNPTIGVAMIVKDAEHSIAQAICSARKYAHQIVIVDTGSIDNTPQICSRLGAEVHFKNWTNNFSEARNYAISRMRTEWILQLDADEELLPFPFDEISPQLNNPTIGGLQVEIQNILAGGIESVHHYTRLFRRSQTIRYAGAIHEQIADSIRLTGLEIVNSPIIIRHHGYEENSPEKLNRNTNLLKSELARNPEDPWLQYHLGLTEFAAKNYSAAKNLLESIVHSIELTEEQTETSRLRLAQIALIDSQIQESNSWLNFSSNDIHREGLRWFILGSNLAIDRQFKEALQMYSKPEVLASGLVNQTELQSYTNGISQFLK